MRNDSGEQMTYQSKHLFTNIDTGNILQFSYILGNIIMNESCLIPIQYVILSNRYIYIFIYPTWDSKWTVRAERAKLRYKHNGQ